jgi:hypothetical protein
MEDPDILKAVGEALYGRQWQAPLSRDLGVTDRTIRNWAAGLGCPDDLPVRLLPILRQRGESVTYLITTLENRPAPSSRGGTGAGGGEPRLCRDGGGAEEGAHTPFGPGRAAAQDVRPGCVRVLEVWRQAAGVGVREGSRRGESDSGAPGVAHGECAPGPCARAAPERVVLKLKPPQPAKRARHLPRPSWEGGWGRRVPQSGCAASPPAWHTAHMSPSAVVLGPPRPLGSSPLPQHRPHPSYTPTRLHPHLEVPPGRASASSATS